jgi:hypothetical protein
LFTVKAIGIAARERSCARPAAERSATRPCARWKRSRGSFLALSGGRQNSCKWDFPRSAICAYNHFSCDLCGQSLSDRRYVVKVEVFAAFDPEEIDEEDLDADHLQEISDIIQEMEAKGAAPLDDCGAKHFRFDLCQNILSAAMRRGGSTSARTDLFTPNRPRTDGKKTARASPRPIRAALRRPS